ncbi:MAG: isochorismatase family cysteine hydrolase [Methanobacteriota archaeon]
MYQDTVQDLLQNTKVCLFVIDMQNDYCSKKGGLGKTGTDLSMIEEMVPRLAKFLTEFRKLGLPIIHTKNVHSEETNSPALVRKKMHELAKPGSWGGDWFEEYGEFKPKDNECVIGKNRFSAFEGTNLDLILRSNGIETVIITGVTTEVCVETTARLAFVKNYNVILVKDCVATISKEIQEASLKTLENFFAFLTTSGKVLEILGKKVS